MNWNRVIADLERSSTEQHDSLKKMREDMSGHSLEQYAVYHATYHLQKNIISALKDGLSGLPVGFPGRREVEEE